MTGITDITVRTKQGHLLVTKVFQKFSMIGTKQIIAQTMTPYYPSRVTRLNDLYTDNKTLNNMIESNDDESYFTALQIIKNILNND